MGKNADLFAWLKQKKDEKKATERATAEAAIEARRGDALVALDAWLQAGRPTIAGNRTVPLDEFNTALKLWTDHDISSLEDLALDDYKLRHPAARGHRSYIFRAIDKSRTGGYYCRYCSERLTLEGMLATVGEWLSDAYAPVEVQQHLTECALRSLSGQVCAVAPGRAAG